MRKSHCAISPSLSAWLLNRSPWERYAQRKTKDTSSTQNSSSAWHNSCLLCFCVCNDFYRQNRTACTCVAGDGQADMERHLCIGTSMWQLAYSLVRPAHSSAVLARAFLSLTWHNPFLGFSNSKCCGLLPSVRGKMGSHTTGNSTAATNPVSNYLIFIALNTSHQPKTHSPTPMHTTTEYPCFSFHFWRN